MNKHSDLTDYSDKKLRTLRNNLNNRLESFKKNEDAKALPQSHMLHGLDGNACKELLDTVQKEMRKRAKA